MAPASTRETEAAEFAAVACAAGYIDDAEAALWRDLYIASPERAEGRLVERVRRIDRAHRDQSN